MFVAAFTFGDATLIVVELPFMFLWIWISIGVVFDIFRSRDLSNWSKALRVMAIFILRFWASWATSSSEAIHAMSSGRDRNRYEAFRRFSHILLRLTRRGRVSTRSWICEIVASSPARSSTERSRERSGNHRV